MLGRHALCAGGGEMLSVVSAYTKCAVRGKSLQPDILSCLLQNSEHDGSVHAA
jgi:hypothetical protein